MLCSRLNQTNLSLWCLQSQFLTQASHSKVHNATRSTWEYLNNILLLNVNPVILQAILNHVLPPLRHLKHSIILSTLVTLENTLPLPSWVLHLTQIFSSLLLHAPRSAYQYSDTRDTRIPQKWSNRTPLIAFSSVLPLCFNKII